MSFNINTATNAELKQEIDNLKKKYHIVQQEAIAKWNELYDLSEQYNKIIQLLNKREGKIDNGTER